MAQVTQNLPECQNDEALAAGILARLAEVPETEIAETGWRREVSHRGRYWHWRRGSGKQRISRTGGRFETMPEEAQEAYYARIAERHDIAGHHAGPGA